MYSFDPKDISVFDFQDYLLSAVSPRPIAFASTIDAKGMVNLSPFSFFNAFGSNPPILIFAPNRRLRDNTQKDTYVNICEVEEVVINMVDFELAEQMSLTSCEFHRGINEFDKAGLTELKSDIVRPPRVAEAKVAFECKVVQKIEIGDHGGSANLVICEIVRVHISEEILNENKKIDPAKTDWIARGGGDVYYRVNKENMFVLPKPNKKIGVGVEKIPANIRAQFSGNELGRLGNVSELPTDLEVMQFVAVQNKSHLIELAKYYISENYPIEAWKAILGVNKI